MEIKNAKFIVLDTETTGFDPKVDRVVEISLCKVSEQGVQPLFEALIDPQCKIPPEASAIHHITNKHVQGKPIFSQVWPIVSRYLEGSIVVAHNAMFDRSFLPEAELPWLCTMRLAHHLWPTAPKYSNQFLRYWLDLNIDDAGQAHSAAADALITGYILQRELSEYQQRIAPRIPDGFGIEKLLSYAASHFEIQEMPFGKYKGVPISTIPLDYVRWVLENVVDLDPDLRWNLENVLFAVY